MPDQKRLTYHLVCDGPASELASLADELWGTFELMGEGRGVQLVTASRTFDDCPLVTEQVRFVRDCDYLDEENEYLAHAVFQAEELKFISIDAADCAAFISSERSAQ